MLQPPTKKPRFDNGGEALAVIDDSVSCAEEARRRIEGELEQPPTDAAVLSDEFREELKAFRKELQVLKTKKNIQLEAVQAELEKTKQKLHQQHEEAIKQLTDAYNRKLVNLSHYQQGRLDKILEKYRKQKLNIKNIAKESVSQIDGVSLCKKCLKQLGEEDFHGGEGVLCGWCSTSSFEGQCLRCSESVMSCSNVCCTAKMCGRPECQTDNASLNTCTYCKKAWCTSCSLGELRDISCGQGCLAGVRMCEACRKENLLRCAGCSNTYLCDNCVVDTCDGCGKQFCGRVVSCCISRTRCGRKLLCEDCMIDIGCVDCEICSAY